jgi:Flp pilus assembly pilin Flp
MDSIGMRSALKRFVADDDAQELVEYAYLAAFIGLAGLVVWANIVTLMGDFYTSANTNVENLWASPDP